MGLALPSGDSIETKAGGGAEVIAEPLNLARFVTETNKRRTAHQLVRDTLRRAILSGSIPGAGGSFRRISLPSSR